MPFVQTINWVAKTFRERRRSPREDVRYSAWIDTGNGSPPRLCDVVNVSEDGARLRFAAPWVTLPAEFSLVFTKYGRIRRRCRVVWRSDTEVGVSYLGPLECENPPDPYGGSFLRH